ncbi:MAG TPA: molybdopterin containing oxidoreductase [Bacteroidetes bacterium]|nr:molybdopterin containing oxidoreductase [Bacteroidota bacterium]
MQDNRGNIDDVANSGAEEVNANQRSRRNFLKKGALAMMGVVIGAPIVFAENLPKGLLPVALEDPSNPMGIDGKHPGLIVLNDRPLNMETPPHLLDDAITPGDRFFVRNNGLPPENVDVNNWTLTIDGESAEKKVVLTLKDLKSKFQHHSYQLTLECGGNGRSEFNPPAKGNQWTTGAVACATWTGVRLKDVLDYVGIKSNAVYVAYEGRDGHLSRTPGKLSISRGVPIQKAMEEESLIAWEMNGEKIPAQNGYPLRMVIGGWPASCSGKWLSRIRIRNIVHDGPKMTGTAYRVPCKPVAPGTKVKDEDMCIIESMPVKSLITYPKTGATIKKGQKMKVRGHAWAGDLAVKAMQISVDFGKTWTPVKLAPAANRLAWQHWSGEVSFSQDGYYEVWARATDSSGQMQPMVVPGWNPKGYLNNACHRIAVRVK